MTPRKGIAMIRSARQVRPVCDQLDTKTLLSAGVIGQAPSREAAEFARDESVSRDYIDVQTSGFKATDVTWILMGERRVGGPLVELERGRVANLKANTVHVVSTAVSRSSIVGEFVFSYEDGSQRETAKGIGVARDGKGTKPSVPTLTLPGVPGNMPPDLGYYYFAELDNETGNNNLEVYWSGSGGSESLSVPTGDTIILFSSGGSSISPSFYFVNSSIAGPYVDYSTAASTSSSTNPDINPNIGTLNPLTLT
jgi:hypothetical protein